MVRILGGAVRSGVTLGAVRSGVIPPPKTPLATRNPTTAQVWGGGNPMSGDGFVKERGGLYLPWI